MALMIAKQCTMWTDSTPTSQADQLTEILMLLAIADLILEEFVLRLCLVAQHLFACHF